MGPAHGGGAGRGEWRHAAAAAPRASKDSIIATQKGGHQVHLSINLGSLGMLGCGCDGARMAASRSTCAQHQRAFVTHNCFPHFIIIVVIIVVVLITVLVALASVSVPKESRLILVD